ncbi:MAG: LytTR family transcriptional regulator DNA-binding domain-containing protein [Lachnospiraceae bacterium]|nr:LytTR family transcriptional regulator DNA-binding domain-containing protein [Lachnospiraceae bacterium]
MLRLNLYHDKKNTDEHIDIYYAEMKPVIQKVIDITRGEKPELIGSIDGERTYLPLDSIYYMDVADKRVFAYTKDNVYQLPHSLAQLEDMLQDYGYVRISKSNIINIFKIRKIKSDVNMRVGVIFDNDEKLYINRSYKNHFNEYLKKIRGGYEV